MNKIKNQRFAVEKLVTIPLKTLGVILVGLVITIGLSAHAAGQSSPASSAKLTAHHLGVNSIERTQPGGEYAIYVLKNGEWQKAGTIKCDKFLREQSLDLSRYLPDKKPAHVRIVENGGGAAHIDAVLLGNMPPANVKDVQDALALKKLSKRDFDVVDAFEKTLELTFPTTGSDKTLRLKAKVEPKRVSKTPFQFPSKNLFKEINGGADFYTYRLEPGKSNNSPDIKSDGPEKPFFKEYCRTGSGHPSGFTYGWVRNDEKNLYVRVDFTPDNTMDGDKDYAKLFVKTDSGLKTFKISESRTEWGKPDFTYTDTVSYQHKIYSFEIPLKELKAESVDEEKEILLAFSAYGTATPGQHEPAIAAGKYHTLALKSNGKLYAWGRNNQGQLGVGGTTDLNSPVQVGTDTDWTAIAGGESHTLALKSNGELYAWGYNAFGQLGTGDTMRRLSPTKIGLDTNWTAIAAGDNHSLALKSNGELYAWGPNNYGRLGTGDTTGRLSPTKIGLDTNWTAIAADSTHTLALKSNGELYAWGRNNQGQLGVGDHTDRHSPVQVGTDMNWTAIAAGNDYTLALKSNGELYAWGNNHAGQLGVGDNTDRNSPVQVGTDMNWTAIAADDSHTMALKSDGSLWAWGDNYRGKLGVGGETDRNSPVQVGIEPDWTTIAAGYNHSVALQVDMSLYAWGHNYYGQLGTGNTATYYTPVYITHTELTWKAIAGTQHTLASKSNGTLWAWGYNNSGQLGDGTTTNSSIAVRVKGPNGFGYLNDAVAIAAGYYHSVALQTDGKLYAWGENNIGQLGDGCTIGDNCTDSNFPVQVKGPSGSGYLTDVVAIAAWRHHTLALKSDGTLYAWGYNYYGELGVGDNTHRTSPDQVGTDTNWVAIAAGYNHTLALKSNGTLWAWGRNEYGQLGDGTSGDSNNENTPVQVLTDVVAIAAGTYHSLALKSDGTLHAWGRNNYGQLGDGTSGDSNNKNTPVQVLTDVVAIAAGYNHTLALKSGGTLWAWGQNSVGQLGQDYPNPHHSPFQIGSDTNWTEIAAGYYHSLALKSDGTLWAWGQNIFGQLGDGTTYNSYSPTAVILISFRAYEAGGQVVVEWETASEIGTVGFYLLRLDEETGKYRKVNKRILPGLLHSPQGGVYSYVDEGAESGGTYTYQLVEVEVKGKKRTYGPFTVTVGGEGIFGSAGILAQSDMESLSSGYSKKAHKKSSAKKLRIESTALASGAVTAPVVSDTVRIEVNQSGLYYVDASEIAAVLGQSINTVTGLIKQKALILSNQGQMVAWLAAAGNAGIYFYGEAIDSIYTNENVMQRKTTGRQPACLMTRRPITGCGTTSLQVIPTKPSMFRQTVWPG
jgi:alpha-tubulin suppressor-like RCC1 family protein